MNTLKTIKAVVQEEDYGCGIASVANILQRSYSDVKAAANALNIHASDPLLWSDTLYVRRLLAHYGMATSADEIAFQSWQQLPDTALLSIKHHQQNGVNFWHWVVFKRIDSQSVVLDSSMDLACPIRVDFEAMQVKWFIALSAPVGRL